MTLYRKMRLIRWQTHLTAVCLALLFSSNPATAIDSVQNESSARQAPRGMTAEQQWGNVRDMELTRKIRQILMRDRTLSASAKNVKIISQNGKVTLKGLVRTGDEEAAVLSHAQSIAGPGQVDDQLDIRPSE
ncbi:MAG: BON domain-containing protein [Proteobacteria bacterium]|nr:MAG: BON domain-containing protein [Pseudomonadota bacterium]